MFSDNMINLECLSPKEMLIKIAQVSKITRSNNVSERLIMKEYYKENFTIVKIMTLRMYLENLLHNFL